METNDQAALIQHELHYKEGRRQGDKTSELARIAVAHAFAEYGVTPLDEGIPAQSTSLWTGGAVSSFAKYKVFGAGRELLRFQFEFLLGRAALSKTWIDVPAKWNVKFGRSATDPNIFGCVVVEANENTEILTPVRGTMFPGLSVRYTYKTGEPVTLSLVNKNTVLATGHVISKNCE